MATLAKILLPVDFSGRCRGAARYAEALANRFDAEILMLHVLPPPQYEFSVLEAGESALRELYAAQSAQAKKDLESHLSAELVGGLKVRRLLLEGDPARKIAEIAGSERVDLIVMPTHSYGPFRRFILGSVTAKVLHDSDCPVWTGVHLEDAPPPENIALRNVVAAVDLGPESVRTLEWAAWLASSAGARLTLVHATPSLEGRTGEYFDPDWRAHLAEQARVKIAEITAKAGANPELLIEDGDAPHVACSAAERLRADVLVVGRGSAAGMFGRLRTNAYAIIRQSPCPVVSV
jgi:nucleotide-binding universal stress UspA family protein